MDATTTIEIEQQTAELLREKAEASGLSLDAYLRLLAECGTLSCQSAEMTTAEIDLVLDEISRGGEGKQSLPADFSREDIYLDHD
jgi:hypothetical protein